LSIIFQKLNACKFQPTIINFVFPPVSYAVVI
jgi:hypothetical protein